MGNQHTSKPYTELELNEIVSFYKSGMSFTMIGKLFKRQKNTIKSIVVNSGVWVENRNDVKIIFNDKEIETIKKMYTIDMLNTTAIGKHFNVSSTPIRKVLKNAGLLRIGKSNGQKIILSEEQKKKIVNLYLNEYKNTFEIGEIIGCSSSYINNVLIKIRCLRTKSGGASVGLVKRFSGVNYDEYLLKLPEQEKYRRKVIALTNKQPIKTLNNYEKRGVSGIDGAYHLDHKYSILEGFKNNIEPNIIASLNNLVFISWKENVSKRTKCSISKEQLINI